MILGNSHLPAAVGDEILAAAMRAAGGPMLAAEFRAFARRPSTTTPPRLDEASPVSSRRDLLPARAAVGGQ